MNSCQKQKLRKAILKNMIVLVDSREQKNSHVIDHLNDNQIKHQQRKLEFGDYSFKLGKYTLESYFAIERKNSLDELISNSIEKDSNNNNINRIERELLRAKESEAYLEIMVEENALVDIFNNEYSSSMSINSVLGKINKYKFLYNCNVQFVSNPYQRLLEILMSEARYNLHYNSNLTALDWLRLWLERVSKNISGEYIVNTCLGWAMNNLIYKNNIAFREELLKYLGVIR